MERQLLIKLTFLGIYPVVYVIIDWLDQKRRGLA